MKNLLIVVLSVILGYTTYKRYNIYKNIRNSRSWYILKNNSWEPLDITNEVDKLYELYLSSGKSEFYYGPYFIEFESKSMWKLWLTHGDEISKMKYLEI